MAEHPGRLKELVRGFSTRLSTKIPGIKQQPFRKVDLPRVQIISSIKATQAAVQKIARIEGISEDAAAKRLRSIGSEIASAKAKLSGILRGLEAGGKTQPITVGSVVRRLTGGPKTRLQTISPEIARLVAQQQTKVLGATIRVVFPRKTSPRTPDRALRR